MRDRYYRLLDAADLPDRALLVRIWQDDGILRARIVDDEEQVEAAPDLILFRAALLRLRHNLMPVFIGLDDLALWREDWGDLIAYAGGASRNRWVTRAAAQG